MQINHLDPHYSTSAAAPVLVLGWGLPGHPTMHPVNKAIGAHNRARLLPTKGEGRRIPPLTCSFVEEIRQ